MAFLEQAFPGKRADREHHKGMDLRDYFAAQAMAAMEPTMSVEDIARKSYELADAMIARRTKGGELC